MSHIPSDSDDTAEGASETAKEFLDLWQKNMESLMKDPQAMQWAASFLRPLFSLNSSHGTHETHGPASAGTPPVDGGELLRELQKRLDALESRLAGLESKTGNSGAKTRKP